MKRINKINSLSYVSPIVEIVLIGVEKGYAGSNSDGSNGMNTPGWGGL